MTRNPSPGGLAGTRALLRLCGADYAGYCPKPCVESTHRFAFAPPRIADAPARLVHFQGAADHVIAPCGDRTLNLTDLFRCAVLGIANQKRLPLGRRMSCRFAHSAELTALLVFRLYKWPLLVQPQRRQTAWPTLAGRNWPGRPSRYVAHAHFHSAQHQAYSGPPPQSLASQHRPSSRHST